MNERIQELAVKAKLMAEEDINRQISYNTELKSFAEKFAELIVEQCFRVALVEGKGYLDPIKLRNAMKQHFGVEE